MQKSNVKYKMVLEQVSTNILSDIDCVVHAAALQNILWSLLKQILLGSNIIETAYL